MLKIDTDLRQMRTCTDGELSEMTGRGWQLICVIQESSTGKHQVMMPCPERQSGGYCNKHSGYSCPDEMVEVDGSVTKTKYLIGRPADDAMVELANKINNLQNELHTANSETSKAESARETARGDADRALKNLEKQKEIQARDRELRDEAETRARETQNLLRDERKKVEKLKEALAEKALK